MRKLADAVSVAELRDLESDAHNQLIDIVRQLGRRER